MVKYVQGECQPMADKDFFRFMTRDRKGRPSKSMVSLVLKHYPELAKYYDANSGDYVSE